VPGHPFLPHRLRLALLALWAGLWAAASAGEARALSISDTEFADGDWTIVTEAFPGGAGDTQVGAASGFQVAAGGNPDAYRQGELAFVADVSPFVADLLIGNSLRSGAVYDPSTEGAIVGIDTSIDALIPFFNDSTGGIVLRQAGTFYYSSARWISSLQNFWQTVAAPMQTAADFLACEDRLSALCAGAGTGSPDFSASGGPIEFGFWHATSTQNSRASTFSVRVDNWSITTVPEPSTAALGLGGFLLLAVCRDRGR